MPLKPLFAQIGGHVVAEFGVAFDDLLRHVRLDRLHVRRQKQPRAVRALLMNVVDDLRVPDVVNLIDGQLRLDLRERVPVAVVVVADVFVIKLGRIGAFVWRAESFLVPVVDDIDAVGIEARHEQDDRVVENLLYLGSFDDREADTR